MVIKSIIAVVSPALFIMVLPWLAAEFGELVWDLYIYSAIYLPIGILAMLGTNFGKKGSPKKGYSIRSVII